VAHVREVKPYLAKLDDRSTPVVFLGYEQGTAGYRVYDPVGRRVHVSRDVVFDEEASWSWGAQGEAADAGSFTMGLFTHTVSR
jgi:hypothetical protein